MALITVRQVAQRFRMKCADGIYDDIARGIYPPGVVIRIGQRIRFDEVELDQWLKKGGTLSQETENQKAQQESTIVETAA
jgi:hypothetical protein